MADRFQIDGHKLDQHPARVAQWLAAGDDWEKQKKVYPIYVEVSPAGACNHRCTFCAVDYIGYQTRYLAPDVMSRMLTDMGSHGVRSIMFAGEGEPLLAKGLGQAVNEAKAAGIDTAITTNATPLTDRFVCEALGAVTWMKASINGGPETYAAIHKASERDFELVMNNLANAVRRREERGWSTTLGAQMVLLPQNAHEVRALAYRCRSIGLDYLVVKPYSQHLKSEATAARGFDRFRWQPRDLETLADLNTPTFQVIVRSETAAHAAEPERYYAKCNATPNFWAYVMADGSVWGCSAYLLDERFRYGNVNEESFSEVWEGERRRASAEYVREHLDISECRVNCRMEAVNRHLWDLTRPSPHRNFI